MKTEFTIKRKVVIEESVTYKKYIAIRISELRKSKKLTQEDFGNLIGLSRSSVANIEKGRQAVTMQLLYVITLELGVNSKDILPF